MQRLSRRFPLRGLGGELAGGLAGGLAGTAFLLMAVAAAPPGLAQGQLAQSQLAQSPNEGAVARGEYIFRASGCLACHSARGEEPLAGGRRLETSYGVFVTPNITPDPETGIGGWSRGTFVRALREGVSPTGEPYYPAFPYTSYTGMSDEDASDLFAYLMSRPAVVRENEPHALTFPYSQRWGLWAWRWLNFEPAHFTPDENRDRAWNRGAYLVRHLGHCGECHTPRDWTGARDPDRELAGSESGPEGRSTPNITPHDEGIGDWSEGDIAFFLETAFYPDGDVAGGGMGEVVFEGTSHLTEEDRRAIATYLLSLPALADRD